MIWIQRSARRLSYFGMGGFVTASIDSKSSDKAAAFNAADIVMNKCILAVERRH